MAEVHIIGEVCYAKDFAKKHLFCKWELEIGKHTELFTLVVKNIYCLLTTKFRKTLHYKQNVLRRTIKNY